MTRLESRRTVLLFLGLAAALALALGLWLGVFEPQRASADPLNMSVTITSSPASGATLAQGSVISYTVTVTTDAAPGVSVPLNVAVSGGEVVTTSVTPSAGIACPSPGATLMNCTVAGTFTGSGTVVFNGKVTAAAPGPMLVGAALDPAAPGNAGAADEGAAGDTAEDGGSDALACDVVWEATLPNAGGGEPDNFACTSHTVAAGADLVITKSSNPALDAPVGPGTSIVYTLTVTNVGTVQVAGAVIRDYLGSGLTFASATPSSGSCFDVTPPEINCSATIPAAGSVTVAIVATVAASVTGGDILNGARVDPDNAVAEANEEADDPDLTCAAVGEGTEVPPPGVEPDNYDCTRNRTVDLTMVKTASPADGSTVATGATITYTLTARNATAATAAASSVLIRDWLGTGLTFVSIAPGAGSNGTGVTCGDTTAPYDCTASSIPPGESRTVTVVATVSATSGTVMNGARVDPDGTIVETNEDADDPTLDCGTTLGEGTDAGSADEPDNYDCTSHSVGAGLDLTISKTASPSDGSSVASGATITYTLTASATGGTANNVVIRDKLGTGLTFVSITGGTGVTCSDTTGPEYDCTATTVATGTSRTVTVVATVSATSGTVLNGARVDPSGAITETNEDADDPALDCSAVGEGTDAGDATEPDNFDCTSHTVSAAATRTLNLSPAGWHNFVWTGATGTDPGTALACISGSYQIAYEWVDSLQAFERFVQNHPELSNMDPLTKYDPLLVLITAANVTCQMPVVP